MKIIQLQDHDIETIMKDYSKVRLELYSKRKQYQLNELDKQIVLLRLLNVDFILDVVEERLTIYKQSKENIKSQLEQKEYPLIQDLMIIY